MSVLQETQKFYCAQSGQALCQHPALPHVAHRRMSRVQLSSGSPSLDRRFAGSSAIVDLALVVSIPSIGDDGKPVETTTWYLDAFMELSKELAAQTTLVSTPPFPHELSAGGYYLCFAMDVHMLTGAPVAGQPLP